jgi:hypothetical protein
MRRTSDMGEALRFLQGLVAETGPVRASSPA